MWNNSYIFILKDKSRPSLGEVAAFLNAIRDYFYALQYNHVGTQLFDISKAAGYSRLMEKAKVFFINYYLKLFQGANLCMLTRLDFLLWNKISCKIC